MRSFKSHSLQATAKGRGEKLVDRVRRLGINSISANKLRMMDDLLQDKS